MELDYSQQVITTPFNAARKRQAPFDVGLLEIKKRHCTGGSFSSRDLSWQAENAFNLKAESHIIVNGSDQLPIDVDCTALDLPVDEHHRVVDVLDDDDDQMELMNTSHSQVCQQLVAVCPRCLAGESGHINHLSTSSWLCCPPPRSTLNAIQHVKV